MLSDDVIQLAEMFRLLGEPSRLTLVARCLDAPVSVGDLAERSGLSPSLVSHHLRLLRAARLLRAERRGRQVFYVVADHHVRDMLHGMIEHAREPGEAGEALDIGDAP